MAKSDAPPAGLSVSYYLTTTLKAARAGAAAEVGERNGSVRAGILDPRSALSLLDVGNSDRLYRNRFRPLVTPNDETRICKQLQEAGPSRCRRLSRQWSGLGNGRDRVHRGMRVVEKCSPRRPGDRGGGDRGRFPSTDGPEQQGREFPCGPSCVSILRLQFE